MRGRAVLGTASSLVLMATMLGGLGVNRVLAQSTTLDGLTATGTVESSPESFWFGQVNRDGICRLISGCVAATGSDPNWVFTINVALVGAGTQQLDAQVRVLEQVAAERVRYALDFASPLGGLSGEVGVNLAPKGAATTVTLRLSDMVATGFAQESIPAFQSTLQPYLTAQLKALSRERVDAGTKVKLTVTPGKRAKARAVVTASSLTRTKPKASGFMRVLIGNRVVCTGAVRASTGSCQFPAPKKGVKVRAVVTGRLSNGYPVWNSGTARYGR